MVSCLELLLLLMLSSCAAPTAPTAATTEPAPTIQLSDATGVIRRPLDELPGQKAVAFIFVGIDCPISNSYAPEINRIVADYAGQGIAFYIVYPDSDAKPADVRKHAQDFGYTCPALLDPQHRLAKQLGATVTPEVAVLSPDGAPLYRGRIDDVYADVGKRRYQATTHDLRDALDAIAHDRKVATPVTKAIGCEL